MGPLHAAALAALVALEGHAFSAEHGPEGDLALYVASDAHHAATGVRISGPAVYRGRAILAQLAATRRTDLRADAAAARAAGAAAAARAAADAARGPIPF